MIDCRQQGFGGSYDDRGLPSRGGADSDSDSELDIEGEGGEGGDLTATKVTSK